MYYEKSYHSGGVLSINACNEYKLKLQNIFVTLAKGRIYEAAFIQNSCT